MLERQESAGLQRQLGKPHDNRLQRRGAHRPERFGCSPPDQRVLVAQGAHEWSDRRFAGGLGKSGGRGAANRRGGIIQAAGKHVKQVSARLRPEVADGLDGQRAGLRISLHRHGAEGSPRRRVRPDPEDRQ